MPQKQHTRKHKSTASLTFNKILRLSQHKPPEKYTYRKSALFLTPGCHARSNRHVIDRLMNFFLRQRKV